MTKVYFCHQICLELVAQWLEGGPTRSSGTQAPVFCPAFPILIHLTMAAGALGITLEFLTAERSKGEKDDVPLPFLRFLIWHWPSLSYMATQL